MIGGDIMVLALFTLVQENKQQNSTISREGCLIIMTKKEDQCGFLQQFILIPAESRIQMDNETNEISNNESNENTKSRKRKVIDISNNENPKSGNPKINKFPSVVYGLFEVRTGQTYIIILHTPGIADKSGLLISSVNDKVISIESYFNEKIVPGKTIISYLPVSPFEMEVEFPSKIEATSAKVEIEHGISTVTALFFHELMNKKVRADE
ncbi:unnamed protein product [Rhizophagus irregularis]|uniref:Uncharacterized protein n=2 Tax=Rhizophagus irregularis TaxID=588596 RepID=A0A916E6E1_9GLOM|nr:unnamed protein product [Rhizophagus irregularis]